MTFDSACGHTSLVHTITHSPVNIYPNPFYESLSISVGEATVRVYSAIGQLVYSSAIQSGVNVIDTREFVGGVYIVEVVFVDGSKAIRKIIKE